MTTRFAFVMCLAAPSLAFADVPPPRDYVETCTVEKQCKADEEGVTCGANHTDREACDRSYGKDGYTRRCKTYGASVWTEVWCRAKGKVKPKPEKKK